MNNRFGDSRQRFSIRKFTVGVASVLLSFAVFGVSTAKAEQAEEPLKGNQRRVYLRKLASLMVGAKGQALVSQVMKRQLNLPFMQKVSVLFQ